MADLRSLTDPPLEVPDVAWPQVVWIGMCPRCQTVSLVALDVPEPSVCTKCVVKTSLAIAPYNLRTV